MTKKSIITTLALVVSLVIATGSAYARKGGQNNGHWNGDHNSNYRHDSGYEHNGYGHSNGMGRGYQHGRYGHSNGMGRGYQHGRYGQGMQTNVGLTDAQKVSLENLENEYVAKVNPIRQNLAVKSAEYAAIMKGQNPNPTEAGKVAGEIAKMKQELQKISSDYVQTIEKDTGITMGGRYHHNTYNKW